MRLADIEGAMQEEGYGHVDDLIAGGRNSQAAKLKTDLDCLSELLTEAQELGICA